MLAALTLLLFGLFPAQTPATSGSQGASKASETKAGPKIEPEVARKLLKVRRIYVETFGDDAVSKQLQATMINALDATKRFIITENKDKADAVLKGNTVEETHQEIHSSSESTHVKSASISDQSHSTETINEARLAVRLVASDGDVIWSTTQESKGAKYKGASADVADKVVKQLLRDLEKLQSQPK